MLGNLIGGVIIIAVALIMYPLFVEEFDSVLADSNVIAGWSETSLMIFESIPLVFLIVSLIMAITIVYQGLKSSGALGGGGFEDEEEDEDYDYECDKCGIKTNDVYECDECERDVCRICISEKDGNFCRDCYEKLHKPKKKIKRQDIKINNEKIEEEIKPMFKENKNFESKSKYD